MQVKALWANHRYFTPARGMVSPALQQLSSDSRPTSNVAKGIIVAPPQPDLNCVHNDRIVAAKLEAVYNFGRFSYRQRNSWINRYEISRFEV
jgi:hypothetical protein